MDRVVHFEVFCDDIARGKAFYEKVFNWKFEKWDGPFEYWLASTGDTSERGINGALLARTEQKLEGQACRGCGYVCTIAVEDLDKTTELVKENGGKIVSEKMDLADVGAFIYFVDTEGNRVCALQPPPRV